MIIDNNYDGASIDVLKKDDINNYAVLSPKKEKDKYSNYFNFKVLNTKNIEGKIHIKNLNKLMYKNQMPNIYFKKNNEYELIDKERITVKENEITIKIHKNETIEITSYPRYILNDFNDFISKIDNKNIYYTNEIIPLIIAGRQNDNTIVITARQHPGETLSSYFIEGIIESIIDDPKIIKDNKIIIFPIVNTKGVKNGNHRYIDGIDYNRSWNTNKIKEIDYIKKIIDENNIKVFIDVHCDEITKQDYIRSNKGHFKTLGGIMVLEDQSKLIRFLRALIKQRKIINLSSQTAREYISKKYKCESMLVELSLKEINKEKRIKQGRSFIKEIIKK